MAQHRTHAVSMPERLWSAQLYGDKPSPDDLFGACSSSGSNHAEAVLPSRRCLLIVSLLWLLQFVFPQLSSSLLPPRLSLPLAHTFAVFGVYRSVSAGCVI